VCEWDCVFFSAKKEGKKEALPQLPILTLFLSTDAATASNNKINNSKIISSL